MRFSLLLVVFAALSPILAAPMPGKNKDGSGRKAGTNFKKKTPHEAVDANPGDIVLVQSQHIIGEDQGKGSSKRKIHPGVVIQHDQHTHIVHVAPIGHKHPGGEPTMPGSHIGLPETPEKTAEQSLVSLGRPKQVLQEHLMPLKALPVGSKKVSMPGKLEPEHFNHLMQQIPAHNLPLPEPVVQGKGKKKVGEKSKRELDLELQERYFLESMFDDEW